MNTFGETVRKKRREKGMSVRTLAEECSKYAGAGVSRSSINFLEIGKNLPTYNVAAVLAEVLGIDIEKALREVYKERVEHYKEREKNYLSEYLNENKKISVDSEKIIGK